MTHAKPEIGFRSHGNEICAETMKHPVYTGHAAVSYYAGWKLVNSYVTYCLNSNISDV